MGDRLGPGAADVLDRPAHAERIDVRRGRKRADRDRHIEAPAVGADHIGEQEGAPLLLVKAALELPAHQRMKLGVLVDRALDAHQQAGGFEIGEMLLEIRRDAGRCFATARPLEHEATFGSGKRQRTRAGRNCGNGLVDP